MPSFTALKFPVNKLVYRVLILSKKYVIRKAYSLKCHFQRDTKNKTFNIRQKYNKCSLKLQVPKKRYSNKTYKQVKRTKSKHGLAHITGLNSAARTI